MYSVFYGLPVLVVIAGIKGTIFPKPQVILYPDGFAYPNLGLKKLPWTDIRGTRLHEDGRAGKGRKLFSPESDRRLDLLVSPESSALRQIRPFFRIMLSNIEGCVVVPVGLMGARITTRELQKIIDTLIKEGESGDQRDI